MPPKDKATNNRPRVNLCSTGYCAEIVPGASLITYEDLLRGMGVTREGNSELRIHMDGTLLWIGPVRISLTGCLAGCGQSPAFQTKDTRVETALNFLKAQLENKAKSWDV